MFIQQLLHDIRMALRSLARAPLFALVAIATLAIGTGAVTSLFGVVQTVFQGALPFHDGERLLRLRLILLGRHELPVDDVLPVVLGVRGVAAGIDHFSR